MVITYYIFTCILQFQANNTGVCWPIEVIPHVCYLLQCEVFRLIGAISHHKKWHSFQNTDFRTIFLKNFVRNFLTKEWQCTRNLTWTSALFTYNWVNDNPRVWIFQTTNFLLYAFFIAIQSFRFFFLNMQRYELIRHCNELHIFVTKAHYWLELVYCKELLELFSDTKQYPFTGCEFKKK
jgi:hypothetical protein